MAHILIFREGRLKTNCGAKLNECVCSWIKKFMYTASGHCSRSYESERGKLRKCRNKFAACVPAVADD